MNRPRRTRADPRARQVPRTARLNELLREIVAEELERIDDERLELVTVTDVDVDADLNRAMVCFDSLAGEAGDADVLEALARDGSACRRPSPVRSTPARRRSSSSGPTT